MFFPEVVQAKPNEDYTVEVLFHDGKQVKFDMKPYINSGVFVKLQNIEFFMSRCTVMNHTLAWDTSGGYDPTDCIDIDPETIYEYKSL